MCILILRVAVARILSVALSLHACRERVGGVHDRGRAGVRGGGLHTRGNLRATDI